MSNVSKHTSPMNPPSPPPPNMLEYDPGYFHESRAFEKFASVSFVLGVALYSDMNHVTAN